MRLDRARRWPTQPLPDTRHSRPRPPRRAPLQIAYTGAADAAAIGNFVSSHSLPAVVLFTQESAPRIFRGPLRTHFLLFANAANESNIAATAAFRASALANRGTALYVRVDPAEERISQYFGVTEADMPTAVLVSMPEASAMKKFGWPKGAPLTTEAFDAHIAGWKAGSLKPTLKSEPVPDAAAEAAAAVKTVVGDSFADVVLDGSKDVLLEVYAPCEWQSSRGSEGGAISAAKHAPANPRAMS